MKLFLLLLAAVFVDTVQHFAHVFDLLEERGGNEQRALLRAGQREAITWTGIDLDELAAKFILLLENQAGEISRVLQLGNDRAFHGDVEALEHAVHQVMREWTFLRRIAQKHADNVPHGVLDLNHENFLVVPDENGATAVRGEDSANLDGHNVILHTSSLWRSSQKTSVPVRAAESGKMRTKQFEFQRQSIGILPISCLVCFPKCVLFPLWTITTGQKLFGKCLKRAWMLTERASKMPPRCSMKNNASFSPNLVQRRRRFSILWKTLSTAVNRASKRLSS